MLTPSISFLTRAGCCDVACAIAGRHAFVDEYNGSRDADRTGRAAVTLLAAGVGGFAVLLVLVTARWGPIRSLDVAISRQMDAYLAANPTLVDVLIVIEWITHPYVLRAIALIVAFLLFRQGLRRLALWLAGTVVLGFLIELFFKALIARSRPEIPDPFLVRDSFSFPSGHALGSALIIGALLLVVWRRGLRHRHQVLAWAGTVLLILLVGFDRVALSAHYVSDVLAGWFLAFALLGGTMLAYGVNRTTGRPPPALAGGRRRRVAVVVNPSKLDDFAYFRSLLNRIAVEHGWRQPVWFETTPEDAGHAMTRAALAAKADLVIAAGGDGTVRVVCAELASSGVPVAVVPVGTGNLLARNLGLPLDRGAAIEVALNGADRSMDLVRVSGDSLPEDRFAVMAGIGLDALIVGEAPDRLKARMGWAAYFVSAARHLSGPAIRVAVSVDSGPEERLWARTVIVGNVGTLHGGLSILPDAQPDDGMLDVLVVAPRRLTDWPSLAWRVVRRSPAQDDRLRTWRGKAVSVRALDSCPRQLDGDVVASGREINAEIEPGVLLVRVPRS
jgi:diacylglycerol kinase family enzyme/membrane-associated phospholipid phosphatase